MEAQRGLATWPESHSQGVPEQGFKPWGKRTHRMFKMWVKRLKLSPHASDMGRVARGAGAEAGALQLSWPCGLAMLAACVLSCVHVCHTTDCCPPSSSDHGIFQARRLEWVTFSCSRGSSGHGTRVSCVSRFGRWILYHGAPWEGLGEGEVDPLSHLYPFIRSSTHSFSPSPNRVNTERWGRRENSDTAWPLLTSPPRHRAPGS